jgi:hypothetical protein
MDIANLRIRKRLEDSNRIYLLLANNEEELLPKDSIANIIAINKEGYLLWTIEPPTTKYDIYARMYLEGDNLFAVSSAGQLHQIDKKSGKIISSEMVK